MELRMRIEDLRFSYRDKPVLDGITLDIIPGEVIGIIGPNGCGKTTLLKHLNRNLDPSVGRVLLNEEDIKDMHKSDIAKHVASVPQSNEIHFSFTVRDIVTMGRMPFLGKFQGESSDDVRKVDEAMLKTNILGFADRYINTMSGGERQRVIIARALAQTPEIMLLDEPTLHLDISNQFDVLELVRKLSDDDGLTVIIVSHDLPMVVRYCDRIVMLKDHKIFAVGTPEEVLTPANMKEIFNVNAVFEKDATTGQNTVRIFGSCNNRSA
ncbi:MAG: ABC transporter ATP-binding protein [Methanomassiliicoccaceae archaeon]|jgi:iron complex transport system ATP-binding protein|nr:ABC transporter ATP-binding protein [Methanomassiliicoccaceae archaeon]